MVWVSSFYSYFCVICTSALSFSMWPLLCYMYFLSFVYVLFFRVYESIQELDLTMRPVINSYDSQTYTTLLEEYLILFFFVKTCWISTKHTCMRRPWTFIFMHEIFPPVISVTWWQAEFEWNYSHLSLVSVDGKQHMREVVFCAPSICL